MIIGQLLDGNEDGSTTYYSPWFPRGGNRAVFACEVINTDQLLSFAVSVQTKNSESSDKDAGTFVPNNGANNAITLSAGTITTFTVGAALDDTANNGFLELVRFVYTLYDETAGSRPWVHFRMLNPIWLTN